LGPISIEGDSFDLSGQPIGVDSELRWKKVFKRVQALNDEDKIKLLDLSNTQAPDEMLPYLHGLNNVDVIDLRNTRITEVGIELLRKSLPNCKILQ
jgi:hypothetical protein